VFTPRAALRGAVLVFVLVLGLKASVTWALVFAAVPLTVGIALWVRGE
jgi:hypothetical protein